jgi:hypothetical protein
MYVRTMLWSFQSSLDLVQIRLMRYNLVDKWLRHLGNCLCGLSPDIVNPQIQATIHSPILNNPERSN